VAWCHARRASAALYRMGIAEEAFKEGETTVAWWSALTRRRGSTSGRTRKGVPGRFL
jgi:hypothetical protein